MAGPLLFRFFGASAEITRSFFRLLRCLGFYGGFLPFPADRIFRFIFPISKTSM